ncbi:amino acid permease [Ferdinandcohnia quinoae]|uniref:Amino acid permease n=1 Tax=Fredinandcohnia quinoae TaxID=2918902 RepID=A0AAW5EA95_9BACI|nr:amino acid permease [Fredinandcohnia sp. SECRCQ15]MCH1627934.1 amino acid permease [Fredinandcohnia sp. SECRCQ15]
MAKENSEKKIKWWQLSLFGVGCTIGTGFFLGSSIAIRTAGPSVLLVFIIAAIGTYLVYDGLAKMTVQKPEKGTFRTYAKKAFGKWAGFSIGWIYWSAEILIMGSQLTALSIFTKFWFPNVPLWIFASIYGVLGLCILLIGTSGINKLENIFALIKISAILMFIVIAVLAVTGTIEGTRDPQLPTDYFPKGILGLWSALIFAYYAFGGIEVMGLMATQLKYKNDAPRAGKVMLLLLTIIYLGSIGLAVMLASKKVFTGEESTFVVALGNYNIPILADLFNGALIIGGFSTMVAALYGVTSILVNLSEDGDAPKIFSKRGKLKVPLPAFILTTSGLLASIIFSLLMPDSIYEYITTGAGLMLLYNWLFILLSANRLLKPGFVGKLKYYLGMLFILLAVSGTLFSKEIRPGFFISLGFVVIIGIFAFVKNARWKKKDSIGLSTLFEKLEKP